VTLVVQGKDGKRATIEVKAPVRPLNTAAQKDPSQGGMKH